MSEYYIELKTDKNLGDPVFVKSFLTAWLKFERPQLRPEFFSLGEPIRKSFEKEGLDAAIDLWLDENKPLMLRRGSVHRFTVDIKWSPNKGKDERMYPWGCSVWLAHKAGDVGAKALFRFLIEWFDPAFGFVTTWDDLSAKHKLKYQTNLGLAEKFVGLDVGATIPGLYWQTFFGKRVLEILPFEKIKQVKVHNAEELKDGLLLCLYETSTNIAKEDGLKVERAGTTLIGSDLFFKLPVSPSI